MNEISWNCVVQGSSRNFPLLFLHGFMGSSFEWMEIIINLKKSCYCLALDLPGHGKTEIKGNDSCYSIQFTAKEICRFLQDLTFLGFLNPGLVLRRYSVNPGVSFGYHQLD